MNCLYCDNCQNHVQVLTTETIFSESAPQIKALDRNLSAFSTLFAPGKSWDNVRSTAAPYTESRLARLVRNKRVGFPVVEQWLYIIICYVITKNILFGSSSRHSYQGWLKKISPNQMYLGISFFYSHEFGLTNVTYCRSFLNIFSALLWGGTTGMQFRRFSYSNLKNRFSSHHIIV